MNTRVLTKTATTTTAVTTLEATIPAIAPILLPIEDAAEATEEVAEEAAEEAEEVADDVSALCSPTSAFISMEFSCSTLKDSGARKTSLCSERKDSRMLRGLSFSNDILPSFANFCPAESSALVML